MQTFIFRCLYQEHKLVISVYLSQCFSAQSEIGNRKPGNLMLCELVFRSHKISDTTWTSFEAKQLKTIHTPQFWLKLFSNNFYDKCFISRTVLHCLQLHYRNFIDDDCFVYQELCPYISHLFYVLDILQPFHYNSINNLFVGQ